jgi:DUF1365 family protein
LAKAKCFPLWRLFLRIPIEELSARSRRGLFSVDGFNLISIRASDYSVGGRSAQAWVPAALDDFGLGAAAHDIQLITMPRVLGYAFNPVSFWFCHNAENTLGAVIAAVSNTFGERHCYLCFHEDGRPISTDDWLQAEKIFHVSPFLPVEGHYRFRFAFAPGEAAIWINHYDSQRLILSTSLIGTAKPMNSARLLFCFIRYPLVTFKVVALIHYQAVKLFLKGMRHFRKPTPPVSYISR